MIFKVTLLLVCLCCCAFGQDKSGYNGQPGCQTSEEMTVKLYRNFWDPTAYFECVVRGQPGERRKCHDGYGFMTSKGGCVPWMDWVWEPEVLPPSQPINNFSGVEVPNEREEIIKANDEINQLNSELTNTP